MAWADVRAWISEAWDAAQDALSMRASDIEDNPSMYQRMAAGADARLFALRCEILAQTKAARDTTDETAKTAILAEIQPWYKQYVMLATVMYGSVDAAKARYIAAGGCPGEAAVGFLPALAALPPAAWYASGAVLTTAAVAYAAVWYVDADRQLELAHASTERVQAFAACAARGIPPDACERVATPTQAEADSSSALGDTLRKAGEGAGAAAEGGGSAALGIGALVVGAAVLLWVSKQ